MKMGTDLMYGMVLRGAPQSKQQSHPA